MPLSWRWIDVPSSVCCVMLLFSISEAKDLSSESALTDQTHCPLNYLVISKLQLRSSSPPPLKFSLFCFDLSVTGVHRVLSLANVMSLSLSLISSALSPQIPLHACPTDTSANDKPTISCAWRPEDSIRQTNTISIFFSVSDDSHSSFHHGNDMNISRVTLKITPSVH